MLSATLGVSGPVSCVGELHCSDTSSLSVTRKVMFSILWMTSVIVSGAYLIMTIFSVHVPSFDDERRFAGLGTRYGFFYYGVVMVGETSNIIQIAGVNAFTTTYVLAHHL